MKTLRTIIKLVGWLLIVLSGMMLPLIIYNLHAVIWGGAVKGEVIALETFAPSKSQAITEFVVVVAIFVLGLVVEHFGTKTLDKIIRKKL